MQHIVISVFVPDTIYLAGWNKFWGLAVTLIHKLSVDKNESELKENIT